jgi:hypothetical protein
VVVDGGGAGGGDQFVIGRVGAAIAQIGPDGVVDQIGFLGHDADQTPQRFERDLPHIMAVYRDAAGVRIVQTGDQIGQRRLARAGCANKRDQFAGPSRKRDVVQRRRVLTLVVAERNLLKGDLAREP